MNFEDWRQAILGEHVVDEAAQVRVGVTALGIITTLNAYSELIDLLATASDFDLIQLTVQTEADTIARLAVRAGAVMWVAEL